MAQQDSTDAYLKRVADLSGRLAYASSTYSDTLKKIEVEEWLLLCACHLRRLHDFGRIDLSRYDLSAEVFLHIKHRKDNLPRYALGSPTAKKLTVKMVCDRLLHSAIEALQVGELEDRYLFHAFVVITDRTQKTEALNLRIDDFADVLKTVVAEGTNV